MKSSKAPVTTTIVQKTAEGVVKTTRVEGGKPSESRPRFRLSQYVGWNLRRHPRRKARLGQVTEGRENTEWEVPTIHGVSPANVLSRTRLKDLYGVRTGRLAGYSFLKANSRWRRPKLVDGKKAPLGWLDRRVDVLLHRSGLVNSIGQARQLIRHGHVVGIHRPSQLVEVGERVSIEPGYWERVQAPASRTYWSNWTKGRVGLGDEGFRNEGLQEGSRGEGTGEVGDVAVESKVTDSVTPEKAEVKTVSEVSASATEAQADTVVTAEAKVENSGSTGETDAIKVEAEVVKAVEGTENAKDSTKEVTDDVAEATATGTATGTEDEVVADTANEVPGCGRVIPRYLEVDFTVGAFVLVTEPTLESVVLAGGLGRAAAVSLY